jgi:Mlc titration factor MtfA (ptsG expression regulator)
MHGILLCFFIFGIFAFSTESIHPAWGLTAVPPLVVYIYLVLRRPLKRFGLTRSSFPEAWRTILQRYVPYYGRLNAERRVQFERDILFFLSDYTIEGIKGVTITDELRVLVAAGAAMLLNGRTDWELPKGHTILIYPEDFDERFAYAPGKPLLGQTHGQGPVILSRNSIMNGWTQHGNGCNVVLHEFAHLMDMHAGSANGIPRMLPAAASGAWTNLVAREMLKIHNGSSLLRPYAGTNEAEFFAVAVEYFFDCPQQLKRRHPELYNALRQFFDQDPADLPDNAKA